MENHLWSKILLLGFTSIECLNALLEYTLQGTPTVLVRLIFTFMLLIMKSLYGFVSGKEEFLLNPKPFTFLGILAQMICIRVYS